MSSSASSDRLPSQRPPVEPDRLPTGLLWALPLSLLLWVLIVAAVMAARG